MIYTGKALDETDKKILQLKAEGKTYKEIAVRASMPFPTVISRFKIMMRYYDCKDVTHLIAHLKDIDIL